MGSPPTEELRIVGGRYRLLREIGRGAMGPMWRAEDDLLERSVAIKQIILPRRSRDRSELHERILREARAAALLVHRHAVTVLDVLEDDGQPWIVTELLAAESLSTLVGRTGPQSPRRVAEIGSALLSALDAAHASGIVHRDVRPGNVLLGGARIVLSDLGTPALEGDPAYTAPEGTEDGPATPAADLWSLGATLYFAVQGQPPTGGAPATRAGATLAALLDGLLHRDLDRRLDAARARTLLANVLEVLPEEPAASAAPSAAPPPAPAPVAKPPIAAAAVEAAPVVAAPVGKAPVGNAPVVAAPPEPPEWEPPPPPRWEPPPPRKGLRARVLGGVRSPTTQTAAPPAVTGPPVARPPVAGPTLTQFTSETGWRLAIPAGWRSDSLGGGDYTFADLSGCVTITVRSAPDTGDDPLTALKARYAAVQPPGAQAHYLDGVPYRGYRAADYDRTDHAGSDVPLRTRLRSFVAGARTYEISVTAPADRWAEGGPCFAGATDTFVPA